MAQLNRRARGLGGSATMAAAQRTTPHADPIDLSVGEPLEPPPPPALEAASEAILSGRTRYGPPAGNPELRAALARQESELRGSTVTPEQVLVTCGGKSALMLALECLLEPGDEVLVFPPYWPTFLDQVRWCGGVPVVVPAPEARRAVNERTRAVIVNTPNNPTARVAPAEELGQLADLAADRDLWILSDEVYRHLAFGTGAAPGVLSARPEAASRTVLVDSFSKRFSMTGYRVGFAVAPEEVVSAMGRLQSTVLTHASVPGQAAALAALAGNEVWEAERRTRYERVGLRLARALDQLEGIVAPDPESGLYVVADVRGIDPDDRKVAEALLLEGGLRTSPGSAFGLPGHLRFSTGVPEERLDEAVTRIAHWLASRTD